MTVASALSQVLHVVAFGWYSFVFLWHFTDHAKALPGASGFGWFFRYLTFYSFTLQLVQLALCCITAACARTAPKAARRLAARADDLSCALFSLANSVTVLFYTIEAATQDLVEGGRVARPPWLGVSVHLLNSCVAWGDLLLAYPRSFSPASARLSTVLVAIYTAWFFLCYSMNGAFPYPFMNKLPFYKGALGVIVWSQVFFFILFHMARSLNAPLHRWKTAARKTL